MNIMILSIPCDTKVFIIRKGGIYEAIYLGIDVKLSNYGEVEVKNVFSLGRRGTVIVTGNDVYRTAEDAAAKRKAVIYADVAPAEFTQMFMKNTNLSMTKEGFGGFKMSILLTPTFYNEANIRGCEIRHDEVAEWLKYNGEVIKYDDSTYFKTEKECQMKYVPKVYYLDD